jgi:hypothetical protein
MMCSTLNPSKLYDVCMRISMNFLVIFTLLSGKVLDPRESVVPSYHSSSYGLSLINYLG